MPKIKATERQLNQQELIEHLNNLGFNVVDGEMFAPDCAGSVWFHYAKDNKASEMQRVELSWDCGNGDKFPITELLKPLGWFAEPYDSETLFAYKI